MRNRFLLSLAVFFLGCAVFMSVSAAGGTTAKTNYVEGVHYEKVIPAQPTQVDPEKYPYTRII